MHVRFPFIVKEKTTTSAFPTTKLHNEGKMEYARVPCSTSASALPETTLHNERKITHARFPSNTRKNALPRNELHHYGKLELSFGTSTSALPKQYFTLKEI